MGSFHYHLFIERTDFGSKEPRRNSAQTQKGSTLTDFSHCSAIQHFPVTSFSPKLTPTHRNQNSLGLQPGAEPGLTPEGKDHSPG